MKTPTTTVDMRPAAIEARLREVGALSELTPQTRLDAKLDMSPRGITQRLREASDLLALCEKLATSQATPPGRSYSSVRGVTP